MARHCACVRCRTWPKNGFFYVLDRATGELLSAEAYVSTSWASHVDMMTGRPLETGRANWHDEPRFVLPSVMGGHNWHPMAFHPKTGLVYIPTYEYPYRFHPAKREPGAKRPKFLAGTLNTAEDFPALADEIDGYERSLRFCDATHLTAVGAEEPSVHEAALDHLRQFRPDGLLAGAEE